MSLWRNIRRAARRIFKAEYGADLTDVGFHGMGSGGSSPTNTAGWLKKYGTHPRLRAAAARVARDVAKQRWHLYRRKLDKNGKIAEKNELYQHPFLDLWNRPHPRMSGTRFRFVSMLHLGIDGNAFLLGRWRPGARQGLPSELWPIPPHWIRESPTGAKPAWNISIPGDNEPHLVPMENVLWLTDPDPANPYGRGTGVARALDDEVSQDEWAAKWNNQFFRQGARPDILVTIPGLEPKEYDKVRRQWDERHAGFWNAFKPAFLSSDAKVQPFASSHKDLDFYEGRRSLRDIILQTFNLSPEVMGVVENSNRATADAALYLHALNVVEPWLEFYREEFSHWLLPLTGENDLCLEFDTPVRETEEFRLNKALQAWQSGAIRRNECRRELGWDELPGAEGQEILAPANMTVVLPGGKKEAKQ